MNTNLASIKAYTYAVLIAEINALETNILTGKEIGLVDLSAVSGISRTTWWCSNFAHVSLWHDSLQLVSAITIEAINFQSVGPNTDYTLIVALLINYEIQEWRCEAGQGRGRGKRGPWMNYAPQSQYLRFNYVNSFVSESRYRFGGRSR